jgi:hypothetical protein
MTMKWRTDEMSRILFCGTALTLGLIASLAGPASAASKIVTSYAEPEDGGKSGYSVTFMEDCGEECQLATFSCDDVRNFIIEFTDVPAADVAKSLTAPPAQERRMTLTVDKESFRFEAYQFSYTEMTGSWWVEARAGENTIKAMEAVAKAKDLQLAFVKQKHRLPVTKDVKRWATNCLK